MAAFFQIRINGCTIRIYGQFPVLFAASFSVELCDAYVVAVGQGDGERIVPVLCVSPTVFAFAFSWSVKRHAVSAVLPA